MSSTKQRRAGGGPARRSGPAAPRRARRLVRWIALGIVVVLAGAAGGYFMLTPAARPGPSFNWPLPDPDLARMQPRVAERIRKAREVVLSRPESAEAWGRLGAVCDVHDLIDAAAPCYRWAQALSPQDYRWPYLLGYVREQQGADVAEITELFEQAARLEPRFPPTFFRLGDALMREGKTRKACDAYRRALDLYPTLAIVHRSLGQALIAAGDAQAALRHLEHALEYGQEDGAVYAAMARAYTQLGRPEDAEAAAARSARAPIALALPDPLRYEIGKLGISSWHCSERADALIQAGDYAAAIDQLEIVREQLPDNPKVHYRLGFALEKLGRTNEAITAYRHVIRIDPGHAARRRLRALGALP